MSPPWSSALAGSLEEDRHFYLFAFVEARSLLMQTSSDQFPGGEAERAQALVQTEHDYNAIVGVGAEAAQLQATLDQPTANRRIAKPTRQPCSLPKCAS